MPSLPRLTIAIANLRQLIAVVLLVATCWMIYDEALRTWNPNCC